MQRPSNLRSAHFSILGTPCTYHAINSSVNPKRFRVITRCGKTIDNKVKCCGGGGGSRVVLAGLVFCFGVSARLRPLSLPVSGAVLYVFGTAGGMRYAIEISAFPSSSAQAEDCPQDENALCRSALSGLPQKRQAQECEQEKDACAAFLVLLVFYIDRLKLLILAG